jgi:hypothetical protein
MSETPAESAAPDASGGSGKGLMFAVYAAMVTDFGCLIGAVAFVLLIVGSMVFASLLTPCTSAGGIPCGGH